MSRYKQTPAPLVKLRWAACSMVSKGEFYQRVAFATHTRPAELAHSDCPLKLMFCPHYGWYQVLQRRMKEKSQKMTAG